MKLNSAAKWTGVVGGAIGVIISAFMIFKKSSKKASISSVEPKVNSEKNDIAKSLDSIKYLDNKAAESVGATGRY
jgi:hypothetical protein